MTQLLIANKATTLVCTGNLDHEMEWDSQDFLFRVDNNNKITNELESQGYRMHPLVQEIIVWSKSLDFQTTYIARKEDFDEVEMF
jgi:hypothetical protein